MWLCLKDLRRVVLKAAATRWPLFADMRDLILKKKSQIQFQDWWMDIFT
jgi:hypothetical protein